MSALGQAPRQAAHLLIRFYQLTFSALLGRRCRYLPTCSAYADEAIRRHGLWAGGWMATARICRCHPWGGAGYDPPPQVRPSRRVMADAVALRPLALSLRLKAGEIRRAAACGWRSQAVNHSVVSSSRRCFGW